MFDVLVIGGGHSGIEASLAAWRLGAKTALVSMDIKTIGRLSCNPSIGGSAKGHLAKEIDALGGVMGLLADASGLQFKMLNTSKGPAVWSPRSQNDKDLYPLFAQNLLLSARGLEIIPETVSEILVSGDRVLGVRTETNKEIRSKTVVLCSGTFLNAVMWTGLESTAGGRVGEKPSNKVSDLLCSYGLQKGRLKTGTPPRIHADSVQLHKLEPHNGDREPKPFSAQTRSVRNVLACWSTHTVEQTHDILRSGFSESPMFTGHITGSGPRYCPSVEDKIARFADKASHPIVLEPEGMFSRSLYVNGFSTSLPSRIQQEALQSIPGLEQAKIMRFGYAVEYDFFFPYQLKYTLESKAIEGLFFAGQVNGTSGYEEAASQGLIAGINAANKSLDREDFTLGRSDAYIGVLIDDLVNKNTEEPYRIFTSLAEYRLLLRIDTVYSRLLPIGYRIGLVSENSYNKWLRSASVCESFSTVAEQRIQVSSANSVLESVGEECVVESPTIESLVKRPPVRLYDVLLSAGRFSSCFLDEHLDELHQVETQIKYEGYIAKQLRDVARFREFESARIPKHFNYDAVKSLSAEGREKLKRIRPENLGQASRIAGVSASDVSILSVVLNI